VKAADPHRPSLETPREHFFGRGALLAAAVHLLLIGALMLGVHWQSRAPDVVTVELWQAPPAPAPRPEPPKAEPVPPPRPAPPPPKPEPRIEKPDIAVKAPPKPKPKPEPKPEPKPKPAPKPAPKPVAKPKPAPPPPDETLAKQLLAEALQREQSTLAAERERQAIRDQLARESQAAQQRAIQTWVDKIRAKVRGNIVLPPGIAGNPQAEVLVTQLPTGQVLDAKLVISSGHAAYDEAVLRAILKSDPLPKPDSPALFRRELKLTFRPKD
jgi:colicin import membrane protein